MERAEFRARPGDKPAETGEAAEVDLIVEALVEAIVGPNGANEAGPLEELEEHLARVQGRAPEPRPVPAPVPSKPPVPPAPAPNEPSPFDEDWTAAASVTPLRPAMPRPRPKAADGLHPIEERIRRLDQTFRNAAPDPAVPERPETPDAPQGPVPVAPARVAAAAPLPREPVYPRSPFAAVDDVVPDDPEAEAGAFGPGLSPSRRLARMVFAAGLVVLAFMSVPVIVRLLAAQADLAGVVAEEPGAATASR